MCVTTFSQGQSNLSNDDTAENNRQLIDELHDREWPRISKPGPMPGSAEKKQANRRNTEEAERRRGNHLPLPGKGCDQATQEDRLDVAGDGKTVGQKRDIEIIVEVGVRPLGAQNRNNHALREPGAEPLQKETREHKTSERPGRIPDPGAGKLRNSFQALTPITPAGGDSCRFRGDLRKLFLEITKYRFRPVSGTEERDNPSDNRGWPSMRSRPSHKRLPSRSSPSARL